MESDTGEGGGEGEERGKRGRKEDGIRKGEDDGTGGEEREEGIQY